MPVTAIAVKKFDASDQHATGKLVASHVLDPVISHHVRFVLGGISPKAGIDGFSYALSLESGTLSGEEAQRREAIAKLIYEEFEKAAAATPPAPAQPEEKPAKARRKKKADSD